MNTIKTGIAEYKEIEKYSHIDIDAVIHKVTQEVAELQHARQYEGINEQYSEAGDVLVNILSVASELGVDLGELENIPKHQIADDMLLHMLGEWNTKVQGFRQIYSRDDIEMDELKSVTQEFVTTILNFTDPGVNLGAIIQSHTEKFMNRKESYKPDIDPKSYIAEYPDFPKEGINFKDISPLIANPDAMKFVCYEMAEQCRGADKIVALDARGFIFAPIISEILNIPWVMCRKKGKLPGEVESVSYGLEYGEDVIEIQKSAIVEGEKIAIVDDLLATGGTAGAAASLVEKLGGEVHNCAFVIGLNEEFLLGLESRKDIRKYPCSSVVSYN